MQKELLITQILDSKQMAELIYIFNKRARPKPKKDVKNTDCLTKGS